MSLTASSLPVSPNVPSETLPLLSSVLSPLLEDYCSQGGTGGSFALVSAGATSTVLSVDLLKAVLVKVATLLSPIVVLSEIEIVSVIVAALSFPIAVLPKVSDIADMFLSLVFVSSEAEVVLATVATAPPLIFFFYLKWI